MTLLTTTSIHHQTSEYLKKIPSLDDEFEDDYSIFSQCERLERYYNFVDPEKVKSFLVRHNYLMSALFDAHKRVKEIFGEGVDLLLEIHRDPKEGFEELFIIIKNSYPAKTSRQLLNKLIQEWFFAIMLETQKKMNITEEPL